MEKYKNYSWLKRHFIDKKLRVQELADLANTSTAQIWRYTQKFKLYRDKVPMNQKSREKGHQTRLAQKIYKSHGIISSPTSFNYRDKKWLIQKYQKEKLSLPEIAKLCGVTSDGVLKWMIKNSIPRRESANYGPKNGRYIDGFANHAGYRWLKMRNHPQCTQAGYIKEHRFVMGQHLGRYLTSNEVVHHKDGDKRHNDISNLELMTNSDHKKFEQAMALFAKKIMFSQDIQFITSYRSDLFKRFQDFLSKNR